MNSLYSLPSRFGKERSVTRNETQMPLIEVLDLKTHFPVRKGILRKVVGQVKAVDGVDLVIHRGETMGLVGESGCGKTTLGRSIVRLEEPTAGRILFHRDERGPVDLTALDKESLRQRRRELQYIFQDPFSSLHPRLTVRDSVAEPLVVNRAAKGKDLDDRVRDLLLRVGRQPVL